MGQEKTVTFAGESLITGPNGELICKVDGAEQLIVEELHLETVTVLRQQRNWLQFD